MSQTEALSYEIELTLDVEASILTYFEPSVKAINFFKDHLDRYRELDFVRMRRFLNTTYKTLLEIDKQFMADRLSTIYANLEKVAAIYDTFVQKYDHGRRSFEKVFLRVQEDFNYLEKKFETTKTKIHEIDLRIQHLQESRRRYDRKIEQSQKGSKDYDTLMHSLKVVQAEMVKLKDHKKLLHHDNMLVDKALVEFLRYYKKAFSYAYETMVGTIENNLIRILNVMAFELDIEMWHKAKESRAIKERFKDLIQDNVISSKLYLEHYLKNLNPLHMSSEHKELRMVLEYLNTINPISIILLIPDKTLLKQFKLALESDNSGFEMYLFVDVKEALKVALSQKIDLFIIDSVIGDSIVENFMLTYKKNINQGKRKKAKLMLVTDIVDDKTLQKAKALGADSLIERDVQAVEIIDSVYTLIKM